MNVIAVESYHAPLNEKISIKTSKQNVTQDATKVTTGHLNGWKPGANDFEHVDCNDKNHRHDDLEIRKLTLFITMSWLKK